MAIIKQHTKSENERALIALLFKNLSLFGIIFLEESDEYEFVRLCIKRKL